MSKELIAPISEGDLSAMVYHINQKIKDILLTWDERYHLMHAEIVLGKMPDDKLVLELWISRIHNAFPRPVAQRFLDVKRMTLCQT